MPGIALQSAASNTPNPEQSHPHHRHIQHHPSATSTTTTNTSKRGVDYRSESNGSTASTALTQQPVPQFNHYLPPSPPRSRSPSPYFAGVSTGPKIEIDTSLAAPSIAGINTESITSPVLGAGAGAGPRLRMSSTATATYPSNTTIASSNSNSNNNNNSNNAISTATTMQRRPSQNESPLLGVTSNGIFNNGYRINGGGGEDGIYTDEPSSSSSSSAMNGANLHHVNHHQHAHVHFDTNNSSMPNGNVNGYANGYGGYGNGKSQSLSSSSISAVRSPVSPTFGSSPTFVNAPFIGSIYHKANDLIKELPFNPIPSLSSSSANNLPTHASSSCSHLQSSSVSRIGHHNRRKSIAQAVTPSISTVRFASLCTLWYTSSALSSNTGKSILNKFKYPVTLTFIQFGFVAGWCIIFCVGRTKFAQLSANSSSNSSSNNSAGHPHHARALSVSQIHSASGWGIKKPSKKALEGTLVMSGFQIAGHIFSSMAIARVPVSTVHTIKALSPLFTVLCYGLLFRVRYSYNTYVSLLPLTVGVMLACSFDLRANAPGLVCALGSTLVFVSQNIFSKKLLPKEGRSEHGAGSEGGKLDKLHLLLYSSGLAFLLMIPLWAYYDGYRLLFGSNIVRTASIPTLTFYFAMNGSVHFLQNLLAFSILALCSPVTYSIASLIKRIAVICMAIVWFGQTVYPVQAVGISMTFLGLWMYNSAKKDVERGESLRTKVERRGSVLLPSTKEDLSDTETPKSRGWTIVR